MIVVAGLVAYLVGSLPTAAGLAALRGIDLRSSGSGNPGANNALRLGGPWLAAAVLFVEMAKGAAAVLIGLALAGEAGAVVAGIGAVAGNVFNPFYRFSGGKGLGITGGILVAAWPTVMLPALLVLVSAFLITKSSGSAVIATIIGLNLLALAWAGLDWPVAWGVDSGVQTLVLSIGLSAVLWRKHWREARFSRPRPA